MQEFNLLKFLKTTDLCKNFSMKELEQFSSLCKLAKFSAKDQIFEEGDNESFINHFYIVLSGDAQISKEIHCNGSIYNLLINILKTGDCFGEIAILRDNKTRTATIKCLTPMELLLINRCDFLEFYNGNRKIADNLLRLFMSYLDHSNNVNGYVIFSSKDASKRLAYMVDFLKSKYLKSHIDKRVEIELPFNSSKIADFLCMKQQLYSRSKISLKQKGLVEIFGKTIIISDYTKFQAFLGE